MPTSPAARSAYAAPTTAPVMPYALDVVWLTCIATAATPVKNRPTPVSDAPNANEPAAGSPKASIVSATAIPTSRFTAATTPSAAAVGARRPTGAARTSSLRPLCSSARVCRPSSSMLISATTTAPKPPHCHATSPPTLVTAWGGPTIAIRPGLPATVAAYSFRSAWVG